MITSCSISAAPHRPPVLIVAGPTGSGKSGLALDLAEAFDGVIVNADSMQVYRELRILVARPSPDDQARAPHRVYAALAAAERCSVARWLDLAWAAIEEAWGAQRLPIVAGGTGLYLKALTEGLAVVPPVPDEVRGEVLALYEELGHERFRRELALLDAAAAARIEVGDRQRLLRAFEVARATGSTLAQWQRHPAAAPRARFTTLVLLPPRERLYPALDARFEGMLAAGALAEVDALLALGLDPSLPAMKALGVRELAAHLRGEMTLEGAAALAKQQTRRFAKRQMTWLRHQTAADGVFSAQYSERMQAEIFAFIRPSLLTPAA